MAAVLGITLLGGRILKRRHVTGSVWFIVACGVGLWVGCVFFNNWVRALLKTSVAAWLSQLLGLK